MTIRNLEHLFAPKSVALIGASPAERTIGGIVAKNFAFKTTKEAAEKAKEIAETAAKAVK